MDKFAVIKSFTEAAKDLKEISVWMDDVVYNELVDLRNDIITPEEFKKKIFTHLPKTTRIKINKTQMFMEVPNEEIRYQSVLS